MIFEKEIIAPKGHRNEHWSAFFDKLGGLQQSQNSEKYDCLINILVVDISRNSEIVLNGHSHQQYWADNVNVIKLLLLKEPKR